MAIEDAIDCDGWQRDIAAKILDKKADYVLALNGNRGALPKDVKFFAAQRESHASSTAGRQTVDGGHGHIPLAYL